MSRGNSKLSSIDQERLLKELEDLGQRLQEMEQTGGEDQQDTLVAVVRLVWGLELDDWDELSRRHHVSDYLTLPLGGSQYPAVSRLLKLIQRLSHESRHDALTGLLNRRAFHRQLDIEMERCKRMDTTLSLAVLDVDDFKQVNDTFGHPAGDEVLCRLADLLRSETRKINVTARIGGEEFAVLLPGTGPFQTGAMLERLQERLRQSPFQWQDKEYLAAFSAGVTSYRGEAEISVRQLMEEADQALYQAKKTGKDQIECARRPLDLAMDEGAGQAQEREILLSRNPKRKKSR